MVAAATTAHADRAAVELFVAREASAAGNRVEVEVGEFDPRLALAPCARAEPYLLPGTRLWGRTVIGVRCTEGATWRATLPVQVRVFAPALIAARPMPAGTALTADDVRIDEIEISRESGTVLTNPTLLRDQVTVRAIAPGQPIRADMLRARPVVAAGELVRVSYQGDGFLIVADGRALASAAEGQSVRVQIESGRILSGTARSGRLVEIRP
jgi:flagella basal body P-ring formation protein FlgA